MKEKNVARMVREDSGSVAGSMNEQCRGKINTGAHGMTSAEVLNETESDNHSQRTSARKSATYY